MEPTCPRSSPPALARRARAFLFVLALGLRLALLGAGPWQDPQRAMLDDSTRYRTLADNLLRYQTFGLLHEEGPPWSGLEDLRRANGTLPAADANGLRPESFRTPAYPTFIALIQAVCDDPRAVLAAQCVLGALLACLIAEIALALTISRRGAFVAGLLWAIHPALITFDNVFLTESLFNVCTVLSLFVACRARTAAGWSAAGALVGIAGLVRPLGLLYLPAVLLVSLRQTRSRVAAAAWVTLVAVLPSALWAIRNYEAGEGLRVSWCGDATALFHFNGYSISEERGEDWLRAWPKRNQEILARLATRIEPGMDVFSATRRLAWEELCQRPAIVLRVLAKSDVKLYVDHSLGITSGLLGIPYEPSNLFARLVLREQTASDVKSSTAMVLALAWVIGNVAMALVSLWAMVLAVKRRSFLLLAVCGFTLLLFSVATMSQGLERFRMPILLPLCLLTGSLCGLAPQRLAKDRGDAAGVSEEDVQIVSTKVATSCPVAAGVGDELTEAFPVS
jgi:hypothetical protein